MLKSHEEDGIPAGTAAGVRERKPVLKQVWFWVIVGMALGITLGAADPQLGVAMAPLGNGFIKLISMLIRPLVFCTMVSGIARMTNMARTGQIMLKTIVLFEAMSMSAMVIGLTVMNLLQPGRGMNISEHALDASVLQSYIVPTEKLGLVSFLTNIIPDSFAGPFINGNLLQVVFISVLTGFAVIGIKERAAPFVAILDSFMNIVFYLVRIIMWLAPIGAFGSIAFGIGKFGLGSVIPLGKFIGAFYLADLLIIFAIGFTYAAVCKFNFLKYLRYFRDEILLAVATTSSEVVMPQLIQKMEKLGCGPGIAGLVVPAGFTFNPSGIGPYMVMVVCFLAQAMNIPLSVGQQIELLLLVQLTSKSAVGLAGTAFVILIGTMSMLDAVPIAAASLVLGIHRVLATAFVPTFAFTSPLAAIGVSRWENNLDVERMTSVLDQKA